MKETGKMAIAVTVNGKKEEIKDGMSVSGLLAAKNIRPEVVTVELNENILEKGKYDKTILKESDKIEFVYYMGGGSALQSLRSSKLKSFERSRMGGGLLRHPTRKIRVWLRSTL